MNEKRVLVIAGPTGVGESTVTRELIGRHRRFARLVTATTRPPRPREKDGRDYYFFSRRRFLALVRKGDIPEYQNSRRRDCFYGTYLPDLNRKLAAGYTVIVNPDIVGARYYKRHYGATAIFLMPETLAVLEKRLLARAPGTPPAELKERLAYARQEIKNESRYYDYRITNRQNRLGRTVERIEKILAREGYRLD